jgi:predicted nucleic acid-binding Zn ribbon protein
MRRRRGGAREPEAIGALVPRLLEEMGFTESAGVLRLVERWESAVGAEIARHCRPTALRDGVLEATVDSSVWCQQLQLRSGEILRGLRRELGEQAPSALWFRVG